MARRILTAYERVAIWREAEDPAARRTYIVGTKEELLAPWSVKPAPGTLYRGLALRLTPELREQIATLLGDQKDDDETYGQHLKIGPLLLQHIQNTRGGVEQPVAGLGTFWSTDRRVADDAIRATQSFNQEPGLMPVMMTADWDGTGLNYDGMNAGPHNWPGDKEQVLTPGTALRIKNLQIGVPQAPDGRWYEVLNPPDDDADYAGMGPGPLNHTAAARLASTKMAKDGDCTCWEGYERVPGTEPCASKSCRKKTATKARLAMPWYHVSPHDLPEGTNLTPGGGGANPSYEYLYQFQPERQNHVWVDRLEHTPGWS